MGLGQDHSRGRRVRAPQAAVGFTVARVAGRPEQLHHDEGEPMAENSLTKDASLILTEVQGFLMAMHDMGAYARDIKRTSLLKEIDAFLHSPAEPEAEPTLIHQIPVTVTDQNGNSQTVPWSLVVTDRPMNSFTCQHGKFLYFHGETPPDNCGCPENRGG